MEEVLCPVSLMQDEFSIGHNTDRNQPNKDLVKRTCFQVLMNIMVPSTCRTRHEHSVEGLILDERLLLEAGWLNGLGPVTVSGTELLSSLGKVLHLYLFPSSKQTQLSYLVCKVLCEPGVIFRVRKMTKDIYSLHGGDSSSALFIHQVGGQPGR